MPLYPPSLEKQFGERRGKVRVLISAGPTRESIDPIRFISNRSSGKMGYALAEAAVKAGHEVMLVSGPVSIPRPAGITGFIAVESATEMAEAMKQNFPDAGLTVMCAAVADYRPARISQKKLKKSSGTMFLEMERTEDILLTLGKLKQPNQILVGFAAETDNLEKNALSKLERKNLDYIIANEIGSPDKGFQTDTNEATAYGSDGSAVHFPLTTKETLAEQILKLVLKTAD